MATRWIDDDEPAAYTRENDEDEDDGYGTCLDDDPYTEGPGAKSPVEQFNDGCVVIGMIFIPAVIGAFYIARWLFGQ